MKKIKSLLITLMFFLSLAVYGKNINAGNYRINDGKIELLNYDRGISDNVSVKRANGAEVITGSEDLRITDGGGRILVTKISKGLIDGKYDEYYANGNMFMTGKYVDGKKEGEWKTYTEEGGIAIILQEEKNCQVIIQMDTDREYLLNGMKMVKRNQL